MSTLRRLRSYASFVATLLLVTVIVPGVFGLGVYIAASEAPWAVAITAALAFSVALAFAATKDADPAPAAGDATDTRKAPEDRQ